MEEIIKIFLAFLSSILASFPLFFSLPFILKENDKFYFQEKNIVISEENEKESKKEKENEKEIFEEKIPVIENLLLSNLVTIFILLFAIIYLIFYKKGYIILLKFYYFFRKKLGNKTPTFLGYLFLFLLNFGKIDSKIQPFLYPIRVSCFFLFVSLISFLIHIIIVFFEAIICKQKYNCQHNFFFIWRKAIFNIPSFKKNFFLPLFLIIFEILLIMLFFKNKGNKEEMYFFKPPVLEHYKIEFLDFLTFPSPNDIDKDQRDQENKIKSNLQLTEDNEFE